MSWIDDLRAQYLAEEAEDRAEEAEDRRDAEARCPICGGYLGDYGTCVTVGCGGAAGGDREADPVCGDPGGIGVYCERPEGHDGPHGDRHSTWTVLLPRTGPAR